VARFAADGTIYFKAVAFNFEGPSNFKGDMFVTGNILATLDISDLNGVHTTMGALRTAYNAHHHTQPNDGAGNSEALTNTTDHPVV
jgi:hypothetical protein